jgi:hypothetical protein
MTFKELSKNNSLLSESREEENMKTTKYIYGILVLCVSALMLMQSVLAATGPPYVWALQATLSTPDNRASQDPENSGYGVLQVSVWEEQDPITLNWDIFLKYSNNDGNAWLWPALQPPMTGANEINPAVSVTRNHPVTGQEIHVVYQRWNTVSGNWEICHVYTNNLGIAWIGPVVISTVGVSATNPACVYTEDQNNPVPGSITTLFQVVWEEALPAPAVGTQIMYDAFAYDPTWIPVRGYIPGGPFLIRAPPAGLTCELPEIASVDERINPIAYDYTFNIVWQEINAAGNWNVWYVAGTTTTSPPPPSVVLTAGSLGILNVVAAGSDHTDPDIAASQNYLPIGIPQWYYFHIVWVRQTIVVPGAWNFAVDSCYWYGVNPTPASAVFIATPAVAAFGPVPLPVPYDDPTIATKLITPPPIAPTIFEIWFAWEDTTVLVTAEIYYRVAQYWDPPPFFWFTVGAGRVPYTPPPPPMMDIEQNPELWNREDALRVNPPRTHLVFDKNPHPVGAGIEIEYIDP